MKKLSDNFLFCILLCSSFILLVTNSCEFEPTEKYVDDVKKPEGDLPIDVSLQFMTDTINFYWSSTLNLMIDAGGKKVLEVKYYLDGKEIVGSGSNNNYSVLLNLTKPGTHKFRYTIFIKSGSNSLADKLNAEGFFYESKEWTLIGSDYDTQKNLIFRTVSDGLEFTWKPYDGPDFKCYRLKEEAAGSSYDLQDTFFHNTNYVGEGGECRLYIVDYANGEHLWGRCILSKSLPSLKISNINNKVGLTWNTPQFKDNIAEYQVFQQGSSGIWTKIATLPSTIQETLVVPPDASFGPILSFYLFCVPKGPFQVTNNSVFSSYLQAVRAALPGPYFLNHYGATSIGFYFDNYDQALGKDILYKYTDATDQATPVMTYKWQTDFSPNGRYMLLPGESTLDLYDAATVTLLTSTDIKPGGLGLKGPPKISDNGICVLNFNNIAYVYNLLTHQFLFSKSIVESPLKISADGKYFMSFSGDSLRVYQVNSTSIDFVGGIKSITLPEEFDFYQDQPEYLYLYSNGSFKVYSRNDFSLVKSFTVGTWFYNIDYTSHKILTAINGSTWRIYDLNTGNIVQTVSGLMGGTNFSLLNNNTLFVANYKYFLNSTK